jgi:hypothetical protein
MAWARRALLIWITVIMLAGCIRDGASDEEREHAIEAAQAVYAEHVAAGLDFSDGPCIAEELEDVPGWSVDVAHDPRETIDDQPENQCQAYRDGRTEHFVELDPEGNLIRAR